MMSDAPIVDFTSISGTNVLATYANMPPGSQIVFVSETSGQPFAPVSTSAAAPRRRCRCQPASHRGLTI